MARWIIAGVSGVGKSTVGAALADEIGAVFLDADDFHPASNVKKMASGFPLNDEDRMPWLDRLGDELAKRESVVLACSALKKAYRDRLKAAVSELRFVVLTLDREELVRRMSQREHFMPPSLLDSQLADLEISDDVMVLENHGPVDQLVARILAETPS